ncbi:MAG: hypothetical protein V4462_12535 [Pseudomonadota bacterium]
MSKAKIASMAEAWESGRLGRDLEHARPAPPGLEAQIDESLGMQVTSIRLTTELLEDLKKIAAYRGVAYQALIRDALQKFVAAETHPTTPGERTARRGKQAA